MSFADTIWLNATAAQRQAQHVARYNSAVFGTAWVQGWKLGLEAPTAFWRAFARAGEGAVAEFRPIRATSSDDEPGGEGPAVSPVSAAPRANPADDLTELAGIGAKLAMSLNDLGITRFDQIAALDAAGIDRVNQAQPGFKALQARFDLVAQAAGRSG